MLDYDNGAQVLAQFVNQDCQKNVDVCTLTDKLKAGAGNRPIPDGTPDAFARGMRLLDNWRYYMEGPRVVCGEPPKPKASTTVGGPEPREYDFWDLGSPTEWGPDTVLVVDSLAILCNAVMRYVIHRNGRSSQAWVNLEDWGEAMRMVEGMLQMLYDDSIQCNVIINTHVDYQKDELLGTMRGLPLAIGQKLTPKIPRYFNCVVSTRTRGVGKGLKRVIRLMSEGVLELKTPLKEPPEDLPIATGLADLFKLILGSHPAALVKAGAAQEGAHS